MSLYETTGPPGLALVSAQSLLTVGSRRVIDALFVFGLVILPMVAFIALLFAQQR